MSKICVKLSDLAVDRKNYRPLNGATGITIRLRDTGTLRDEVSALSSPDSPESLREAFTHLGEENGVQSLLD